MTYTSTLTAGDLVRFTRTPKAMVTWLNQRDFLGGTMPILNQNVTSLACRGLAIGWSEEKVTELIFAWQTENSVVGDILAILPDCMKSAHKYADPSVASWNELHGREADELAARSAKRPRPLIVAFAEANPESEFTAPSLRALFPQFSLNTITVCLRRLVKHNVLSNVRHGYFTLKIEAYQDLPELLAERDVLDRQLKYNLALNKEIRAENNKIEEWDRYYWKFYYGRYSRFHKKAGLPEPRPSKLNRYFPTSKLMDLYCSVDQEIAERFPDYRDSTFDLDLTEIEDAA